MTYLSWNFFIFVAIIFGVYCLFPRKHRWKVLLISSIFFYLSYDKKYIFFLLFVATTTFFGARFGRSKKRNLENLILCIFSNVILWFIVKGLLGVLRWINSFIGVFSTDFQIPLISVIAPIGISYYMLLAISYVVDVYKKRTRVERSFGKYLLYLSYFPTIVQGPISKYEQLRKQLTAGNVADYDTFRKSFLLILIGVTKKMVIADQVAVFSNYCFANYSDLQGVILYVGALCYSIQLYTDFSGCVDICRGVSYLFGVELIDNFNAPYFSKSIKEFWSKWHISLSTWLKDYIYIPLGGNRKGKTRKHVNLLITFCVSGIWHGSGFNYIAWGLLHAIYQIVGECTKGIRNKVKDCLRIEKESSSDQLYKTVITFNLVLLAWIFFRSGRFLSAIEYIKNMFSCVSLWTLFDGSILSSWGIDFAQFVALFLNVCLVVFVDRLKAKSGKRVEEVVVKSHSIIRWCCYFVLIFNIIFFGVYGNGYDAAGFLYGGY